METNTVTIQELGCSLKIMNLITTIRLFQYKYLLVVRYIEYYKIIINNKVVSV